MYKLSAAVAALVAALLAVRVCAMEPAEPPPAVGMTGERLIALIQHIDEEARVQGSVVEFSVDEYGVMLIYDSVADRMRLIVPVVNVDELKEGQLLRMMQANFDSALDARYAIANKVVWSVFVHPLSSLEEEEFVVGLGETINVAATFGSTYSSGMFVFGGGDSSEIERKKLIERLKDLIRT